MNFQHQGGVAESGFFSMADLWGIISTGFWMIVAVLALLALERLATAAQELAKRDQLGDDAD